MIQTAQHDQTAAEDLGPLGFAPLPHDLLRAAGVVLVCSGICDVIRPYFDPANLIMVYLSGVVYVSLRSRRVTSLATIGASILVFDLIHVPPRWSFKPTDPQYYFTFVVMLVVGLLITELAGRARRQAMVANSRARRTQALNALAMDLAAARTHHAIAQAVTHAVSASLGRASALLLARDTGRLPAEDAPDWLDMLQAQRVLAGDAVESSAVTCVALHSGEQRLGVVAVQCAPQAVSTEQRQLLDAFANQAALAVERALFEQRSAQAAVEAESERLRNTLLSGISHDFRTPLTTILGSATSLLEQDHAIEPDRRRALLQGLLGEARRMHALTSSLLDLTRMQEGAVKPRCEWCPADELVHEVVGAMGERLAAHRLRVDVGIELAVWCDPQLVEQALVNLLDNAVRYSPPGGEIAVRLCAVDGHWTLTVADQGPGLPVGRENEVFQKFYRAPGATSAGTGLGLALCAAIAKLHGGSIEARNEGGARFEMRFPQPELPPTALDTP